MKRAARCIAALVAIGCARASAAPATQPTQATAAQSDSGARVRVRAAETFLAARSAVPLKDFSPLVAADESGGECVVMRTGGSGATTVTAYYPSRPTANMLVSVTFDSGGRAVRYAERRGMVRIKPPRGATPAQIDSLLRIAEAAVSSTTISMDFAVDQAVLSNRPAGKPSEAVLGTVHDVEALERLGPPKARMERMRKLCGV